MTSANLPITLAYQPRNADRLQDPISRNVIKEETGVRKRPGLSLLGNQGTVGQGLYSNGVDLYAVFDEALYIQQAAINTWIEFPLPAGASASHLDVYLVTKEATVYYFVVVSGNWNVYSSTNPSVGWTFLGTVLSSALPIGAPPNVVFVSLGSYLYYFNSTFGANRQIYRSNDGLTWTLIADPATFTARTHPGICAYDGKLWLAGGQDAGFTTLQDVWNSTDGITWTLVTATASWPARSGATLLAHRGYLFSLTASSTTNLITDCWRTTDGVTWTLLYSSGTSAQMSNYAISAGGNILHYYFGLVNYSPYGDVWSSQSLSVSGQVSAPTVLNDFIWLGQRDFGNEYHIWRNSFYTLVDTLPTPTLETQPFELSAINPTVSSAGLVMKSTSDLYHYNGSVLVKVTDADYPATTVPGIVYLDGTYYVMDPQGRIYGSEIENPASWSALNVIQAQSEVDGGVALWRHVNYIVAFGGWSTEFFYDAGNPTGSPLGRVDSSVQQVGCAAALSVAQSQNTLFFMGVTRQRGRSIYVLEGTVPKAISTPYVDRILDGDDLADVFAYVIRVDGHAYYILTLGTSNLTLFFDSATGQWGEWSSLTAGTTLTGVTITSISGKLVTATKASHGLAVGQIIQLTDSAYSELSISALVQSVPSSSTFVFSTIDQVATAAETSTVSITPYTEGCFIGRFHSYILGKDFLMDAAANLYELNSANVTDAGIPINALIRSERLVGGMAEEKQQGRLDFLLSYFPGGSIYERHSDDDHTTWSTFRRTKIIPKRTRLWRLGSFTNRVFEFQHVDPAALQLQSIDLDLET